MLFMFEDSNNQVGSSLRKRFATHRRLLATELGCMPTKRKIRRAELPFEPPFLVSTDTFRAGQWQRADWSCADQEQRHQSWKSEQGANRVRADLEATYSKLFKCLCEIACERKLHPETLR
eukprot:g350.t1